MELTRTSGPTEALQPTPGLPRSELAPAPEASLDVGLPAAAQALFGDRALPVFVPPFQGFHDRFLPLLGANGLTSISRNGPRRARFAAGLLQVNAHVELIQWTDPPSFNGNAAALAKLVAHLRARREGDADAEEPTGILTHHLVQDSESYRFILKLIAVTQAHPAVRWLDAHEVFPRSHSNLAAHRTDD